MPPLSAASTVTSSVTPLREQGNSEDVTGEPVPRVETPEIFPDLPPSAAVEPVPAIPRFSVAGFAAATQAWQSRAQAAREPTLRSLANLLTPRFGQLEVFGSVTLAMNLPSSAIDLALPAHTDLNAVATLLHRARDMLEIHEGPTVRPGRWGNSGHGPAYIVFFRSHDLQ